MKRAVKITDTTLRDAHQSLWATRMRTEEMLPILDKLDNMGYHSLEIWGGATFDVCMRYLNEDPWERLRTLKKYIKKTPTQMLLRGQSLVGYQHYPDDVVERFVHKSVENGIDIIRIFDALNDIRNLEIPMKATKKAGGHVQATISYTISPVHTLESYAEMSLQLEELGADSICIKDMAGLLSPYKAFELVTMIKDRTKLPLQLHSHYVGGMAVGAYIKAIEAGVDVVDTATVPMAFGASQPPVETVVRILKDSDFDTGLDIHELFEVANYFEKLRKTNGYERGVTRISDMKVFDHQIPGGMISNLVSQLEEQKALAKLPLVLEEIPKVRAELGYPPLVTPTSQIVGTQAVLNVLTNSRYKLIPGEVKAYVEGFYGAAPAPISEEIIQKVLGDKKPITCRPADLIEPKMDKLREEIQNLARSEEDVLSYAMFPQVALKFFEYRKKAESDTTQEDNLQSDQEDLQSDQKNLTERLKEDKKMNLKEIKELIKMLDETDITELNLESDGVKVNIRKGQAGSPVVSAPVAPTPVVEKAPSAPVATPAHVAEEKASAPRQNVVEIVAPMVGTYYSAPAPDAPVFVKVGDRVSLGQTVCIVEAMKLMNEIEAEVEGTIVEILVENGQPVEYGQPLFLIEK